MKEGIVEIKKSATSICVIQEYTSRQAVNNVEAHIRQYVLKGNAREEYKKYNYSLVSEYEKKRYKDVIWKNLKTGIKYDKSTLKEGEFWAGRTYKEKSGRTSTFLEAMVLSPPFYIHPDKLSEFRNSKESKYFEDMKEFLLNDILRDCILLDFTVHANEVYIPESITLADGTEYLLPEEERWEHARVSVHAHISYIPLVKCIDKNGTEFLKLSRTELWKSKSGNYRSSYSEFNTRKYEAVDKKYGFERGQIYEDMPEEEQPVRKNLKQWQYDKAKERAEKLVLQQQENNKKAIEELEKEAEKILSDKQILYEIKRTEELRNENRLYRQALVLISNIIQPIKKIFPQVYEQINKLISQIIDNKIDKEI